MHSIKLQVSGPWNPIIDINNKKTTLNIIVGFNSTNRQSLNPGTDIGREIRRYYKLERAPFVHVAIYCLTTQLKSAVWKG